MRLDLPTRQRFATAAGFLMVALVSAWALPAAAAIRYISPTGSSSSAGDTPGTAWSLSKANGSLVAGDVCYVLPGTYSGNISPTNSGTLSSRITWVGSLANPSTAVFGDLSLTGKSNHTFKGLKFNGALNLNATTAGVSCNDDSVAFCISDGGLFVNGGWRCTIAKNSIGNGSATARWNIAIANKGYAGASVTAYCKFFDNTFNVSANAQPHAVSFNRAMFCEIARNRVTITLPVTAVDVHGRIFYGVQFCKFTDNMWRMANNATYESYIFNQRDSSAFNVYTRDTLIDLGPGSVKAWATTSGSYNASVRGNRYESLYVKMLRGDSWYYQNGMRQDTLRYCTFVNPSLPAFALSTTDITGPILIDHNTFVGAASPGVFQLSPNNPDPVDSVIITNNIFYNLDRTIQGQKGCSVLKSAAWVYGPTTRVRMNNNLFSYYAYINVPGDKSIGFSPNCNPGQYPIGSGSPWCSNQGRDCNSRYGSPMFVDSSFATLDPHPRAGSIAIGMGIGGSTVGALPFVTVGPDVTPPAAVANLTISLVHDRNLMLGWTAPGDDGMTGSAAAYDLRWSTNPITAANFATALPVTIQPTMLPSGSAQTYIVLNLNPSTTYYFALKARDEANNWSGVSNVPTATTFSGDTLAPAAIQDFSATP